jgi:predicted ATP-binding protein involved in virulence
VTSGTLAKLDRLTLFEVQNLFSQFSYRIPLKLDSHVTAIIAPNGSGKTICLRLINALFARQWSFFSDVEFESATFVFDSGHTVTVHHEEKSSDPEVAVYSYPISFTIVTPRNDHLAWRPGAVDPKVFRSTAIDRYLPFLTRRGVNQFVHDFTGTSYTFQEVIEEFSSNLPTNLRSALYGEEPEILKKLIANIDCHLIETQRLLILRDDADEYHRTRPQRSTTFAISRKAQTLRKVIAEQLTSYAALSQSLDRSFPKRVIGLQDSSILAPENLKTQLTELDKKRDSLMLAGILDSEADDPVTLPVGPLAPAISRVLSVYAQHTRQKLDSLSLLQARIELFIELVQQRFSPKRVRVSKEHGFEISFKDHKVPLEKLSSGEQHQLVLFFELLFELRENALILIDEPELSLHVAWQKKFVSDLQRIIALNQFDVILATHSPQLISRWTNIVVELGEVDEE